MFSNSSVVKKTVAASLVTLAIGLAGSVTPASAGSYYDGYGYNNNYNYGNYGYNHHYNGYGNSYGCGYNCYGGSYGGYNSGGYGSYHNY